MLQAAEYVTATEYFAHEYFAHDHTTQNILLAPTQAPSLLGYWHRAEWLDFVKTSATVSCTWQVSDLTLT